MAEEFGFFPDETYGPDDFTTYFRDFYSNGIKAEDTSYFAVTAEKGGMNLTVKSGIAYIDGHFYRPHDNLTVTLAESDTEFARIDLVEIKCDYVEKKLYVDVITGEPSETPTVPKLQRDAAAYCLGLAAVTVAANASEITKADIKDLRFDTNYCGIVVGKINTISTTELFAQYEAQWELLKAGCAQDADAVIAAWDALNTTKAVNGITPEGGNVKLTQSNIPSDDIAYQMKYFIQSGTVTVDSSAGTEDGGVNIVFPKKFKTAPLILLSTTDIYSGSTATNKPPFISYKDATAEGFTVKAYQLFESTSTYIHTIASGRSATVGWVALGQILYATITKQPTDQTVGVGKSATFSVSAIGNGITYLWQHSSNGGQTWGNFNVTSSGIVITYNSPGEFLIRCVVTDEFGWSVTSDAAKLIVTGG